MQPGQETTSGAPAGGTPAPASFGKFDLELALSTEDPGESGFEASVRNALSIVGGEFLFAMPCDGTIDDASHLAAVREASADEPFFVILGEDGTSVRVATSEEVGETLSRFARAFVGVLTRIRDEMPGLALEAEGQA